MYNECVINTPIGGLHITERLGAVCRIAFCRPEESRAVVLPAQTELLRQAVCELTEYFAGNRKEFTFPIRAEGTCFQTTVWRQLQEIPYGQLQTYGQIAQQIGNPNACRAVGMANNKNPLPIVIPCHRVIGANGSLVGYAGGLGVKQYLLELEKGRKADAALRADRTCPLALG